MRATRNTTPEGVRAAVIPMLAKALAEAIDLERQAKQAHWNVRGMHFQPLHEVFEKVAERAGEFSDMLAERAAALGASPDGTVGSVAQWSELKAYPSGELSEVGHVRAVAEAVAAFAGRTRVLIAESGDAGDAVTADLFTEVTRESDQLLWFLESHLG